jgi:integrase
MRSSPNGSPAVAVPGRCRGCVRCQRRGIGEGRSADRPQPVPEARHPRGKGRRDQQPPTERKVWEIITCAHKLACPSFAAWLQVAAFTGLRPGELDALRWERIDFDRARIVVAEQFSAATRMFDTPKNHLRREAPLTTHARDALSGLAREGRVLLRLAARRALNAKLTRLPLEGRQSRRRVGGESLPRHPPLRGLVHGQRA